MTPVCFYLSDPWTPTWTLLSGMADSLPLAQAIARGILSHALASRCGIFPRDRLLGGACHEGLFLAVLGVA
jgi:hypothetical protein